MESHARAVIIGGGVVGCSILFHLAKHGWKNVVLLERAELTSGSTWHAAGGIHTISSDPNISRLQSYTINLYREIEEISGRSVGMHATGGLYLASSPERVDYLKHERSKARYMGLDQEFISLKEAQEMFPLIDPSKYRGVLFDPIDGHVDPYGVTIAYAHAARHFGANYHVRTPVIETNARPDGTWDVVTETGTINAEIVVNAGGLWAREVGRLAGLELPVQPMEHHYIVTDRIAAIADHGKEVPAAFDFEGNMYCRQEQGGLLLGTYEPNPTPWMVDATPLDFGQDLLPPDLDRIADRLEFAFQRMPALAEVGIKRTVNGPFVFGPDGNPMIGPVPGMTNYWVAVGVMAGLCQGGGVGRCMAEWMIEGEPSIDVWAMDIARFGEFATREYGTARATDNYARRFMLTYPNEELAAAREQVTTSLYPIFRDRGAVMGAVFGLEHPLWFAEAREAAHEEPTYRRSNAFSHVAEEVRCVREGVGVFEIASYAKHDFVGLGTEAYLDRVLAGCLPKIRRIALTPMLTPRGRLYGDLTVARLAEGAFMIVGNYAAQNMHRRWFESHLPAHGVTYRNRSLELNGLAIAGPKSRQLLSRLTRLDVSNEALKFLDVRGNMVVAGVPVTLMRISFSGELGYELYCAPQYQLKLFEAIMWEGADLGVKPYGARALNSLRLEKNWGIWGFEYRPDYTPIEAGLDLFIKPDSKRDFIGREAFLAEREGSATRRLVAMVVDVDDTDYHADEAVFHNGECVGFVTSGGFAHHAGRSVAFAYIPWELADADNSFEIEILGDRRPAQLQVAPLYDPSGFRMRA